MKAHTNEVERIEDGSDVEPGGQNHLQNVRDVSVVHVSGSEKERHPQGENGQRQQWNGQVQPGPVKRMPQQWNQQRQRDQRQPQI